MAEETTAYVERKDFIALCEQVALIAAELEARDRFADPEGPNGWQLRKTTEIKNKVRKILERQKRRAQRPPSGRAAA